MQEFQMNKLIKENFFVIDSNNLENIYPHMYGYSVSKNGILTDNYYKQIGEYKEPDPQGVYIMIRKIGNEIIINQDFNGGIGLYLYEDKNDNYFALSNSFLLLEEHLIGKKSISFNKEYADNLITTSFCSYSISETLINEIKQILSDTYIIIDIKNKSLKINKIDYKEGTVPLESEEGLQLIDNWADKWGYIFRSLKKQTNNISSDLSGGLDTRTLLSILLNSGINLNEINIRSIKNNLHQHEVDYEIASKISSRFGFKLNNLSLNSKSKSLNIKDTLLNTIYTKLGFHKQFYLKDKFYLEPRFTLTGCGGEILRGAPGVPIQKFIKSDSFKSILGHSEEFFNSSKNLLYRSVSILKNSGKYINNDYEISYNLYSKSLGRNHFGKEALEGFISNIYYLQPLMDPDIKKIKFDINRENSHDLIAYIYIRFAPDLINFPIQGNRTLDLKSIEKAEKINEKRLSFLKKSDFNNNFFIDRNRKSPSATNKKKMNPYLYLNKLFKSKKYFQLINKIYDANVYNWANKYSENNKYHPLSQHYALLAIVNTLDYLLSNTNKIEKIFHKIFYINI